MSTRRDHAKNKKPTLTQQRKQRANEVKPRFCAACGCSEAEFMACEELNCGPLVQTLTTPKAPDATP